MVGKDPRAIGERNTGVTTNVIVRIPSTYNATILRVSDSYRFWHRRKGALEHIPSAWNVNLHCICGSWITDPSRNEDSWMRLILRLPFIASVVPVGLGKILWLQTGGPEWQPWHWGSVRRQEVRRIHRWGTGTPTSSYLQWCIIWFKRLQHQDLSTNHTRLPQQQPK